MKRAVALAAVLIFASLPGLAADRYVIDPQHSKIGFSVAHIVISSVEGRFKSFQGIIVLDRKDMSKSSVVVTIDTDSIDTGAAKRDADLHESELLNVRQYPTMRFESKRIEKRGSQWVAIGAFTLKDVTKEIELPFDVQGPVKDLGGRTRIAIHTGTKIKRHDYHVQYDISLQDGTPVIGEEITVDLQVEATKELQP